MSPTGILNLDSLSVIRLAALLLSLVIFLYLLRVPRRSLATLFLAGVFLGAFLFNAASFLELAGPYSWNPRSLRTVLVNLFNDVGLSLAMVFLILFAYHFPRFRSAERREFRVVFALAVTLNFAVLCLNIVNHFILQWHFSDPRLWDIYWLVFYCGFAAQFAGAVALLFRKAARLSGHGSASFVTRILHPRGRDAEAARALGMILLLPLAAAVASLAMTYSLLPFSLASYLTWLGLLLFYLGFIVTYLNHSSDPLTLQVKLLGVTLVLVLSTMGLVALFVGETAARDFPRAALPRDHSTIRFTPNGFGSYDVRRIPYVFDEEVGRKLAVAYGQPAVSALAFDFPFFSRTYRTVHVLNGPMLYLGERVRENGWGGYNPQPAIAPLLMNLDPSGGEGIFIKSSRETAAVTWLRLPEMGTGSENTIQLVLHADGVIDMSFVEIASSVEPSIEQQYNYAAASTAGGDPAPGGKPAPFTPRLTGIHPGTASAAMEQVSFTDGLPWSGTRPAAIFQSYEAGLAGHLTARIGVLAALAVAASLLALLLIPLLLRTSLFQPLRALSDGMSRVEKGDLAAAVRVQSRDEIGSLARSFNQMVGGLKERLELTKYVSAGTIDALKTGQEPRRVARTLLFTDVRGFTSYTERRTPEQVVEVLNRLLDGQSEIILRHGGDIDKFAGDEIVAVFSGDGSSRRACAAALGIAALCQRRAAEFDQLRVGAGIATGYVIQGMIGSMRRADFTVIGDSVNLASRLCAAARGMQTIVSDSTKNEAEPDCRFRGPYSLRLKGKSEPQLVWLLSDPATTAIPEGSRP